MALYLCVSGHPAGTLSHLSHGDPGDHPRASIAGVRVCSACESGVQAGCLEPSYVCPRDFCTLWRTIGLGGTVVLKVLRIFCKCSDCLLDLFDHAIFHLGFTTINLGVAETACMQSFHVILRSCANPGPIQPPRCLPAKPVCLTTVTKVPGSIE